MNICNKQLKYIIEVPTHIPHWNGLMIDRWSKSKFITIRENKSITCIKGPRRFRRNFNICKCNGISFGLDTWDYTEPTSDGDDIFHELGFIIKTSWNGDKQFYKPIEDKYNISIVPLSMFHYPGMLEYEQRFQWTNNNHSRLCFFSGDISNSRPSRKLLYNKLVDNNLFLEFGENWQDKFYETSKLSRWGLILQGRGPGHGGDAKNQRTPAYTSWGMPLAMNYIPHYPIPFEPNKDFVYVKTIDDIINLKNIDPIPYSKRSELLYKQCLSIDGSVSMLLKLIQNQRKNNFNAY